MKRLIAILLLLAGAALAQNTTTISGVISDLSGVPVTSGQLTFSLKPSADTTISGVARFTPQTIVCGIDGTGAVKNQSLSGACVVTKTTALTPGGAFYHVDVCPSFACVASFNMFATTTTLDITTVAPTPANTPNYGVMDLTTAQTVTGAKTFSALLTAQAINAQSLTLVGNENVSGNATISGTLSVGGGTALTTTNATGSGNLVKATSPTITTPTITTPAISGGTLTSPSISNPAITGNMTYASTTPVANLTASNHPTVFNAAGTQQTGEHITSGQVTLVAGTFTVTLAGSAAYTANTTYFCTATDNTAAAAVKIVQTDASHFTLTGTGTDVINWLCVGN